MAVDSSYIPLYDSLEDYGLSKSNVVIRLTDSPDPAARTWSKDIIPRSVFSASSRVGSPFLGPQRLSYSR